MKPTITITRMPDYTNDGHWSGYDVPYPSPGQPTFYKCGTGCWLAEVRFRGMGDGYAELCRNPVEGRRAALRWLERFRKRKAGHRWAMEHCKYLPWHC